MRRIRNGFGPSWIGALSIVLVSAACPAYTARAQSTADPAAEPMILSLQETLDRALANNFDIAVEKREPLIRTLQVDIEHSAFEPELNGTISRSAVTRPTAGTVEATIFGENVTSSDVLPLDETQTQYDLGLGQDLITGGNVSLSMGLTRSGGLSTVFDPNYNSDLSLKLSQPLLRGFGTGVARTKLFVARNDVLVSRESLEIKVAEVLEQVEHAYWDLVYERKNFKVQQDALRSARGLVDENRARADLGLIPDIEVLVAEAGAAAREEDTIVAEKAVRDAEDLLRQLMNVPEEDWMREQAIIPATEPETKPAATDFEEATTAALKYRPELRQARTGLNTQNILLRQDRNQLRPGLDFQGSVGLEGLGDTYGDSFDRLGSGDFYNWQVALVLNVPLGNREAESAYRIRKLEIEKASLSLQKAGRDILKEVRQGVRQVETDRKRVASSRQSRILAERNLEAENERFRVGLTSTRNLLDFQKDLSEAQGREIRAVTDYNKSLASLLRLEGTLLSERNVAISDVILPGTGPEISP